MPKTKRVRTRRGNNEGSIYQREDGRWCGSVMVGYDNDGKAKRKYYYGRTRAEVTLKLTQDLAIILTNGRTVVQNDDLETLMSQWLHLFKKAEVSPRTYERCLNNAKLHIYPQIGKKHLDEITNNTIQALLNSMSIKGYSLASIRKIKFLLNQFFKYCHRNNFVKSNPVEDCIVRANNSHVEIREDQYKALPPEIRNEFLTKLFAHPILGPICMCQCFGGLRIGEVLALRWKNIDFNNKEISVENAITQVPEFDDNENTIKRKTVLSHTKTQASVRIVPMCEILEKSLLAWKRERWALEKYNGVTYTRDNDYVFGNEKGELRTYSGTRKTFSRFIQRNGFDEYPIKFHFHMLRHTFAAMLFEAKENPRVIQMLLGHKSITTTIQTYNSADRSYFKEATNKLNAHYQFLLPPND